MGPNNFVNLKTDPRKKYVRPNWRKLVSLEMLSFKEVKFQIENRHSFHQRVKYLAQTFAEHRVRWHRRSSVELSTRKSTGHRLKCLLPRTPSQVRGIRACIINPRSIFWPWRFRDSLSSLGSRDRGIDPSVSRSSLLRVASEKSLTLIDPAERNLIIM